MVEVADIDGYDWNWNAKYEAEMTEELLKVFTKSFSSELPDLTPDFIRLRGKDWAAIEAQHILQVMSISTRERVQTIVIEAVETGQSIGETTAKLRKDYGFTPEKAKVIARTETARALGVGVKEAAVHQGRDEKRWVTSGDDLVSDDCRENESRSSGWIPIGETFASGVDTVPQHPNCRCNVRYRTKELEADVVIPPPPEKPPKKSVMLEFRCPSCNHLLGRDVFSGTRILCRHCKAERTAS